MIADLLIKELKEEMVATESMLALVPADKLAWQPHTRSMTMEALAKHVAEISGWPNFCLNVAEVDFGTDAPVSKTAADGAGFVRIAQDGAAESYAGLKEVSDETLLNERWVMKFHGQVIMDLTKYEAIRHSLGQLIHHRAQLGVFLRLLDIPIPGTYGPSADSMPG